MTIDEFLEATFVAPPRGRQDVHQFGVGTDAGQGLAGGLRVIALF
jgi:hypothetical protein